MVLKFTLYSFVYVSWEAVSDILGFLNSFSMISLIVMFGENIDGVISLHNTVSGEYESSHCSLTCWQVLLSIQAAVLTRKALDLLCQFQIPRPHSFLGRTILLNDIFEWYFINGLN